MKTWERDMLNMMTPDQIVEVCILEEYNKPKLRDIKPSIPVPQHIAEAASPMRWFPGESERLTAALLNILVQRNMILKYAAN